jgi:alpha-L-fucosidase
MKRFSVVIPAALAAVSLSAAQRAVGVPDATVRPTDAHLAYQAREIMALVCWGLNTYTGQEWGFGNVPVEKITARQLDPRQWVSVMKTAEIKSVVLVAKHHDGFCLWPSKDNPTYSMSAVPAPNTGRDLVRETADACRRAGLCFGVYLSPWDRHHAEYAREGYVAYFFSQWRDLLENYGEICEIWLDGANGGTGWYGGVNGARGERRAISKDYYRLPELLALLGAKHPRAVAFGGNGERSSVWCGNESGWSPETWWCPRRGADGRLYWTPSEADFPLRRGWYWHANERPKSPARLVSSYFKTVGRGAVMNIGVAPDTRGLICEADARNLKIFGDWVRAFNRTNHAAGAVLTQTRAGNRLVVEQVLRAAATFDCLDLREQIVHGQRVAAFTAEAFCDGAWKALGKGTTIGARRLLRFSPVTSGKVRVTFEGIAPPEILPPALRTQPEVPDDTAKPAKDTFPKTGWRIVDVTCPETGNAAHLIDGRYTTLWHSHPGGRAPLPPPQHVTVDCGKTLVMRGFDYVPRQDGVLAGMVDGYVFAVSPDGKNWTRAAAGEFGNLAANPVRRRVLFDSPVSARSFRLTATHALLANDRIAVAEIDLVR